MEHSSLVISVSLHELSLIIICIMSRVHTATLYKLFVLVVRTWISRLGYRQENQPFSAATWPKLRNIMCRMVNPTLMARTRGRLMANNFRRLAIKKIFDSQSQVGESGKRIEI